MVHTIRWTIVHSAEPNRIGPHNVFELKSRMRAGAAMLPFDAVRPDLGTDVGWMSE